MKKIILSLAAILVVTMMSLIANPAPAHAAASCSLKSSFDSEDLTFLGAERDIEVWTDVDYYHCVNTTTGNRWIEPGIRQVGYTIRDLEGNRKGLNCSVAGWLQEVRFDLYFSDRAGNSINPGVWTLPCAESGSMVGWVQMDRADNPRLINCGGAPRWTADVTVAIRLATDKHTTLASNMWGFIGPFPKHPNCP